MTKNNPQTDQADLELLNLQVKAENKQLNDMKKSNTDPIVLIMQYFDTILISQDRNYWETVFLITNNTEKLDKIEKNQQKIIEKLDKLAEKPSFWGKIKGIFIK